MDIYEQLKRDEGFSPTPYKCTEGFLTIGYGRNLENNPISEKEASDMLLKDVWKVFVPLAEIGLVDKFDNPRQSVFINMAFQMGVSGLLKFKKTINYYQNGDYESCAKEMLDSKWAKQTPNRANRLSEQMRSGEWQ